MLDLLWLAQPCQLLCAERGMVLWAPEMHGALEHCTHAMRYHLLEAQAMHMPLHAQCLKWLTTGEGFTAHLSAKSPEHAQQEGCSEQTLSKSVMSSHENIPHTSGTQVLSSEWPMILGPDQATAQGARAKH